MGFKKNGKGQSLGVVKVAVVVPETQPKPVVKTEAPKETSTDSK